MDTRRHPRLRLAGALTCLLIPLLAACAGHQRPAQPPSPPYKRGARPYSVNGIRYEPLASHKGFQQEGIASSYGADFHGRATSSGEPFDMNAMTAASSSRFEVNDPCRNTRRCRMLNQTSIWFIHDACSGV